MEPKRRLEPQEEPVGPFRAEHLTPGRYELVNGHPAYQAATGGDGATTLVAGVQTLASDADVEQAGVDPGYVLSEKNVRAPDIAVGNVPDAFGFIKGVPRLAVEYAGEYQDEVKLQEKIQQFLDEGTEVVWVVRLIGPRRVEVYERGKAVALFGSGQSLSATGILRQPIPVEALFDRRASQQIAFRNLLARQGYANLDEVREEGREEGRDEGREEELQRLRAKIVSGLDARSIARSEEFRASLLKIKDVVVLAEIYVKAPLCSAEHELLGYLREIPVALL